MHRTSRAPAFLFGITTPPASTSLTTDAAVTAFLDCFHAARFPRLDEPPIQQETQIQHALRSRFREVFGEPHHTMGHDDHWRLESTSILTLNVLVNGSPEKPAVWIFEPQQHDDGVMSRSIHSPEDVEEAIIAIQQRLKSPPAIRTT